jgi:hypothetical protein
VHHAIVDAPPDVVFEAVLEHDLGDALRESRPVRLLFAVRAAPVRLLGRLRGQPPEDAGDAPMHLRDVGSWGWVYLGDEPAREVLVGAVGVFWGRNVRWRPTTADEFAGFEEPGWAKIAWNFSLAPYGEGRTLLTTECRTRATDAASRRKVLRYWRVVGRFAGMVMAANLPVIRRHAEERVRAA